VGGVTYGYKSASLTAGAGLSGSLGYTVTATDGDGNASSPTGFSVSADNTGPTSPAGAAAHANVGATAIKQNGSYWVYANASDAGSGVDTVTADVSSISSGQTTVTLSPCSSSCTAGGTTYAYKSNQLTSNSTLPANRTFTVTAIDAAGNATTSGNLTATVDNTVPAATGVQTANGGSTAGKAEQNDRITLTTGEQLDPASIVANSTGSSTPMVVRITNSGSTKHDFVTFWNAADTTQLPLGQIDLGANGYVPTNGMVTFGASGTASAMVQSGSTLTITLGTATTGARTASTKAKMIWTPSSSATDLAGNAVSTTPFTESGTLDLEF
jgi:hypothetical protein